jgi:hypothetical protein
LTHEEEDKTDGKVLIKTRDKIWIALAIGILLAFFVFILVGGLDSIGI